MKQSSTWFDIYLVNVKSSGRLFQIFAAFSKCPIFSSNMISQKDFYGTNLKLRVRIKFSLFHLNLWHLKLKVSSILETDFWAHFIMLKKTKKILRNIWKVLYQTDKRYFCFNLKMHSAKSLEQPSKKSLELKIITNA